MQQSLNREQRKQIIVAELARFIFRLAKEEGAGFDNLPRLQAPLCPENRVASVPRDKSFL